MSDYQDQERIDDEEEKSGGSSPYQQLQQLVADIWNSGDFEFLREFDTLLGQSLGNNPTSDLEWLAAGLPAFAGEMDLPGDFHLPDLNDPAGPDLDTPIERLEEIRDRIANDPDFDLDEYNKFTKFARLSGLIAAPIIAYDYYLAFQDIKWLNEQTQGYSVEEKVALFENWLVGIPIEFISLWGNLIDGYNNIASGFIDELVHDDPLIRWNPPPVKITVPNGSIKIRTHSPKKMDILWAPQPQGDWVENPNYWQQEIADNLPLWLPPIELPLDDLPTNPDWDAPPGIVIEPVPNPTYRPKPNPWNPRHPIDEAAPWVIRLRQWNPRLRPLNPTDPESRPKPDLDPAEDWKLRKDTKHNAFLLWAGFMKFLNKTIGELDELRDLWEAIAWNIVIDDRELATFDASELPEVFDKIANDEVSVEIDGDGIIADIVYNEIVDQAVGKLSQKEREAITNAGINGVFDMSNASTWANRLKKMQDQIVNQQNEAKEAEE